jgi:hypothetical protein
VQFYTGGAVTSANGYVVHTFTSSGTLAPTTPTELGNILIFTSSTTWTAPTGATQVQYLVIGGGGGGACQFGGGGGAGGLRTATGLSVTA